MSKNKLCCSVYKFNIRLFTVVRCRLKIPSRSVFFCLICGFTSQSVSMVMSVNLTTLFLGRLPNFFLTSTKCTFFR